MPIRAPRVIGGAGARRACFIKAWICVRAVTCLSIVCGSAGARADRRPLELLGAGRWDGCGGCVTGCRTERSVSRICMHTRRLSADLFHSESRSSWYRIDSTIPQISSPFLNCPPTSASSCARKEGGEVRRKRANAEQAGSTALPTAVMWDWQARWRVDPVMQTTARARRIPPQGLACSRGALLKGRAHGAGKHDVGGRVGLGTDGLAHNFLPVARRDALLQPDNPLASVYVGLVLPHRTDTFTKDVIVANGRPVFDGTAQVHVQLPEVLRLRPSEEGGRGAQRWR